MCLHLGATAALIVWLRAATPSVRTVLVGAVLFRLVALPMLPSLSDDGYRYLWDGKVVVEAGVSPYALRPSDPQLRDLQGSVEYGRMNSQEYYSVYPPVPQVGFAVAAALGGLADWRVGWWVWKLLMVSAEGVAILLLLRGVGPRLTALYAWSPLAVVEVAGQGHTEALVLLGLALALQVDRWRWPAASIGLTLAGGTKLYPFLWLPQAWRREGWRGVAASLCLVGLLAAPISAPGALEHIGDSLRLFFGVFDEYAAPYLLFKSLLYPVLEEHAGAAASGTLAIAAVIGVAGLALTDDGTYGSWRRALAVGVVGLVCAASTLHPWYWLPVLYVVPLLNQIRPLLWLITWSSVSYLGYVLELSSTFVTTIGWGGAAVLWWADRRATVRRRSAEP